jgi:hypothetical protein
LDPADGTQRVEKAVFSPDGKRIAAVAAGAPGTPATLTTWTLPAGTRGPVTQLPKWIDPQELQRCQLAFTADGSAVVVGYPFQLVRVAVADGSLKVLSELPRGLQNLPAYSPGKNAAVSVSKDHPGPTKTVLAASVYPLTGGPVARTVLREVTDDTVVPSFAVSADGKTAAVSVGPAKDKPHEIELYDATTWKPKGVVKQEPVPDAKPESNMGHQSLLLSPDGTRLAAHRAVKVSDRRTEHVLDLYDTAAGKHLRRVELTSFEWSGPLSARFTASGVLAVGLELSINPAALPGGKQPTGGAIMTGKSSQQKKLLLIDAATGKDLEPEKWAPAR